MTNTSTDTARIVMRRVHTVRRLRSIVSGATLSLVVVVLALYGIGREVWVAKVFENAPSDFMAAAQFFLLAFTHTEFAVQAFTLTALAAMLWFFRDLGKMVLNTRSF